MTAPTPSRPIWLMTLADLALLLVGFMVLVQVRGDRGELGGGLGRALHARFAADDTPIAIAAERVAGFAPASAYPGDLAPLRRWAGEQLRDPRVVLTVTGAADGTAADVDPATRSGAILAADRARVVAAAIAPLSPARVRVATATGARAVTVTLGFAGERTSS